MDNYKGQLVEDFQVVAHTQGNGIVTHGTNQVNTFDSNGHEFSFGYDPNADELTIHYVDAQGNHNEAVYQYTNGVLNLETFKSNGSNATVPADVHQQVAVSNDMSTFNLPVPVTLDNGVSFKVQRGNIGLNWEAIDVDKNDAGQDVSVMTYGFEDKGQWQGSSYTDTSHRLEYLTPLYFDTLKDKSPIDLLKSGYRVAVGALGGIMTGLVSRTQMQSTSGRLEGHNFYNQNALYNSHQDWILNNGSLDTSNRVLQEMNAIGVNNILTNMNDLFGNTHEALMAQQFVKNVVHGIEDAAESVFAPLIRAYDDQFAVKMNEAQGILSQHNQVAQQDFYGVLQDKVNAFNQNILNNQLNVIKAATLDQAESEYQRQMAAYLASGGQGQMPNRDQILTGIVNTHYQAHRDLYLIDNDPFSSTNQPIDIKQYVTFNSFDRLTDPTNRDNEHGYMDTSNMYGNGSYAPYILANMADWEDVKLGDATASIDGYFDYGATYGQPQQMGPSSLDIYNWANMAQEAGMNVRQFAQGLDLANLNNNYIKQQTGVELHQNNMAYVILGGNAYDDMYQGYYGYQNGIVSFDQWAGLTAPSLKATQRAVTLSLIAGVNTLPPQLLALREAFLALH
ncbi:MAG: hypothetical protein KC462_05955, partial [Cyanobacteria bacterium HKST-UBA05]|nr:hypothetical protein [Cyanobacteria bacterium HKST-UBA05]